MSEAIIEVSIPMRYFEAERSAGAECPICSHVLCTAEKCSLTPTRVTCCGQTICCGCFVKVLRRCRCTADCRAVIGTCPFCREMCRADAACVLMSRFSHCRQCKRTT